MKRALAVGMEGLDVARLQAVLRRLDLPAGTIDGVFGEKTAAAVLAALHHAAATAAQLPDPRRPFAWADEWRRARRSWSTT